MKFRWTSLIWLCWLLCAPLVFAADLPEPMITVDTPGGTVLIDRIIEDGKLVVSVDDAEGQPLRGLRPENFTIRQFDRQATVTAVQPFTESFDVPLNIVVVLDNSYSMVERNAVEPLKAAMEELLQLIRPLDRVSLVVFDKHQAVTVDGRPLRVKILRSSDVQEMRAFLDDAYSEKNTAYETWLFEALLAGYDQLRQLPADEQKFMVVFSDGEDLGSFVKYRDVEAAGKGLPEFGSFTIDFMPTKDFDPTLKAYSDSHQGMIWKAREESSLVPIFKEVATRLQRYYLVSYQFPPEGSLAVEPKSLNIEEIKTIDASPMLGYLYFAENSSEIPESYARFSDHMEVADFDERQFEDTLEKYYQVLNILGKRLAEHPDDVVTLVGCNANLGKEKGNRTLSQQRAEAVQAYLVNVWGIAPERVAIEARNLPAMPSTSRLEEGQADNRRVEVQTESQAILDLVRSTYLAYRTDSSLLTLEPQVDSVYGFSNWRVTVTNADGLVGERQGEGSPPQELVVPLGARRLNELAVGGDLQVAMELEDRKGQLLPLTVAPVQVNFIQTSQRVAEKQDYLVEEKYALILFDFDSDSIGERNQAIVAEIVGRIRELPEATVSIVGHTDNIGKDNYNLKLSERRAKAVYDQILAVYGADDAGRITYQGVGAEQPLYDNLSPETRAFNRTVTITLEYLATN